MVYSPTDLPFRRTLQTFPSYSGNKGKQMQPIRKKKSLMEMYFVTRETFVSHHNMDVGMVWKQPTLSCRGSESALSLEVLKAIGGTVGNLPCWVATSPWRGGTGWCLQSLLTQPIYDSIRKGTHTRAGRFASVLLGTEGIWCCHLVCVPAAFRLKPEKS